MYGHGPRGNNSIVMPSAEAIRSSIKLSSQTPDEIVDDYLNLPKLPYGTTITIDKIGCLNYNPLTKKQVGVLAYKHFRMKCPAEFPECKDPDLDYTDDEQVSPVVIISGNVRQSALNKKLLPISVLIDEKDQFMVKLMNLGLAPKK